MARHHPARNEAGHATCALHADCVTGEPWPEFRLPSKRSDRIEQDAWRLIFAAHTGSKVTFVASSEAHAKAVFDRAKERLTEAQG